MNKLIVPVLSVLAMPMLILGICSCSVLKKQPASTRPALVLLGSETNNTLGSDGAWHSQVLSRVGYKVGTNWVEVGSLTK